MRLDRLLPPLPTPVHQPGRREERPPRRQPESPETAGRTDAPEPPTAETDGGERPASPDHLDITV